MGKKEVQGFSPLFRYGLSGGIEIFVHARPPPFRLGIGSAQLSSAQPSRQH